MAAAPPSAPLAAGAKAALFEEQAAAYARYRFVYPPELYDQVLEFGGQALSAPADRRLALDVATGSGQVAVVLAGLFERVVACDSSQAQLGHAAQRPNIAYELAPAERLPAAAGCADLVTCAQALHWFDIPAFYAEARRVLRPGGTLAVWGYGLSRLASPAGAAGPAAALDRANALLLELYGGTLGPYWDKKRGLVEAAYRGLEPGPGSFARVERRELTMARRMSVNALVGYLSSWSAYAEYRRRHPHAPDPAAQFRRQLASELAVADETDESALLVETPLFLILAGDPIPLQT